MISLDGVAALVASVRSRLLPQSWYTAKAVWRPRRSRALAGRSGDFHFSPLMMRKLGLALGVLAAPAPTAAPVAAQQRASREAAEAASAAEVRCARLLSPEAVGAAARRGPVRIAPFDPRIGAGGTCNYVVGRDSVLLTLDLDRILLVEDRFRILRSGPFGRENQRAVAVGDEAFTHGAFGEHLVARRGQLLLRLHATVLTDSQSVRAVGPVLSKDELIALARRVFTTP